jgi:hypothetical protein
MSFSMDLRRFQKKTLDRVDAVWRTVIIKLYSAVILDTPVLTGRLRGNWQVSIGSPVTTITGRTDMSGAAVVREVEAIAGRSGAMDVVIMRNNLPYAYRIEYEGWSHTKAPEGMVRRNVTRFTRLMNQAIKEGRL